MLTPAVVEMATQSPYLTAGAVLLALAVGITVLRGLLSLAKKIAIIGGIGLLIFGAVNAIAPELVPLMT